MMSHSRVFVLLLIVFLSVFLPATKASAICFDSAPVGDGWGWDGNASCRIGISETESVPSCIDTLPVGDGWGWDGNAACRIGTLDTEAIPSCIDTPPVGDKWGWDGSTSCRIMQPEIPSASTCVDTGPVGDGWGWDGSRSCKLQSDSTVMKIMPVGDSITHGAKGSKSYRYYFLSMLEQEGCSFSTVGSQLENEVPTGFVSSHESYSTMKADHFLTGYSTWSGNNMGIESAMTQFFPDIVLLHIGSNDVYFHEPADTITAEIRQIINLIQKVNPSSTVIVSNIIPWFGVSDAGRSIVDDSKQLGNAISNLVRNINNDSVIFVDVFTGYTRDMMISDLVHPNAIGEQHIARVFFSAFMSAGLCR